MEMLKAVSTYATGMLKNLAADPVLVAILIVAAVTAVMWFTSGRRENINYTGLAKSVPLKPNQITEVIMHCKYTGNFADFDNKPEYKDADLKEMRKYCAEGKKLADADAAKNSKITADQCPSKKLCPQPSAAKRFACLSMDGTKCVGKKDEKKSVALTDAERNTKVNTEKQAARDNKTLAGQKGNKSSVWQGCTYYTATDFGNNDWRCGKTNPITTGVNTSLASGVDVSSIFKYQCTKTDACRKKVTDEIARLKQVTGDANKAKADEEKRKKEEEEKKKKEEADRIAAAAAAYEAQKAAHLQESGGRIKAGIDYSCCPPGYHAQDGVKKTCCRDGRKWTTISGKCLDEVKMTSAC